MEGVHAPHLPWPEAIGGWLTLLPLLSGSFARWTLVHTERGTSSLFYDCCENASGRRTMLDTFIGRDVKMTCHLVNCVRMSMGIFLLFMLSLVSGQDVRFPNAPRPTTRQADGFSCSPMDSCGSRALNRAALQLDRRPCNCDDSCAEYGDCCPDARRYSEASARAALDAWSCTPLRNYDGVFLKRACPSTWTDKEVRMQCEEIPSEKDPWGKLPVTSRKTQLTYKNAFCALCNGDVDDPIVWLPHVECGDGPLDAPQDVVWRTLYYNQSVGSWGFVFPATGAFIACSVDPQMPSTVEDLVRHCVPFISQCNITWREQETRRLCSAYTTYVYEGETAFRNGHCAACNYADRLSCFRIVSRLSNQAKFNPHVFTVLFDVNERGGGRVGQLKRCDDAQVFDPFVRQCRSVLCGRVGQTFREGKCVAMEQPTTTTTEPEVIVFPMDDEMDETTTTSTTPTPTTTPTTTASTTPAIAILTSSTTPSTTTVRANITSDLPSNVSIEINTVVPTPTSPSPNVSSPTPNSESEEMMNNTSDESLPGKPLVPQVISVNPSPNNLYDVPSSTNSSDDNDGPLDCQQFLFNESDYTLLDNSSIYFKTYDRVLSPSDFRLVENKGVRVCISSMLGEHYSNYERKFSVYLAIVSLSGLGISLFCLVLHLACFCLVPDLRNLSGRNLASLCTALLLADGLFIVAQFVSIPADVCAAIGIAMFFAFLSAFFWMNVMAYDVWRALRQATTELRVASGRQGRKFALYSMYAWVVPALLVASAVAVDRAPTVPDPWRPAFGVQLCWFSQKRPLLLFFVAPSIALIIVNAVLFSLSAHMIVSSTRNTARLHASRHRRNFRLYVRLALLMGLTWVSGVVAALADLEPLWYLFVILNTLQGLFIFLCFTCTPKVLESTWSRVFRRKPTMVTSLDSHSGSRPPRKSGLEPRDSADSQSSHTSRTSLTQTAASSMDALY